jgi:hypothetical protein
MRYLQGTPAEEKQGAEDGPAPLLDSDDPFIAEKAFEMMKGVVETSNKAYRESTSSCRDGG